MIYDKIKNTIKEILTNDFNLSDQQILDENQIPNDYEDFFVRFVLGYGNLNEIGNINFEEVSTLVIEVFERKYIEESKINKFIVELRKRLSVLTVINDSEDKSRAKIIQITLNRNVDNEWNRFNMILSIRVIWENENA